ncbi:unnamed protein product [Schistosoma mattheei]|uniref:Uncharacterized protein n=1 Tax=Schistosoma mattheei TaxID=31246 RepID=A0AA85BXA6_9TREM|nr:unnamed protein product [Schistosoma mattheei]
MYLLALSTKRNYVRSVDSAEQKPLILNDIMDSLQSLTATVVEELSLDRGTITEYVNCLKLIMKEQSVYDFKEEFQSIISDINSFDIRVSESSILQTCLNTEMTNYKEISRLFRLVEKKYKIVINYNKIYLFVETQKCESLDDGRKLSKSRFKMMMIIIVNYLVNFVWKSSR